MRDAYTKGLFGYHLLLKTKNWKHYNKIIFKYVNSTVRPSFNKKFAKLDNCGSREQCTRPIDRYANVQTLSKYYALAFELVLEPMIIF